MMTNFVIQTMLKVLWMINLSDMKNSESVDENKHTYKYSNLKNVGIRNICMYFEFGQRIL